MEVIDQAKQIANESDQLVASLEAASQGGEIPAPQNYSSSVTSCSVDPATGNIKLEVTLYPGENPIEPPPAEIPAGGVDSPSAPAVPESQVVEVPEVPPGQVPAQ